VGTTGTNSAKTRLANLLGKKTFQKCSVRIDSEGFVHKLKKNSAKMSLHIQWKQLNLITLGNNKTD
jgi:L-rhamnose isomerase